jgi:hypothetical protein
MRIEFEPGASFIAIFVVLLSGCGKAVDRVRDAVVDRSDIYGKAVFVCWPLDKIGRVR